MTRAVRSFCLETKLALDRAGVVLSHPGANAATLARDPSYLAHERRAGVLWRHLPRVARAAIRQPGVGR